MEQMYQYKECGLDNIYLSNGYTVVSGSRGETVSIEDIEGLHRAIGEWIVRDKKFLDGREARFLRQEMGLSQAQLAMLLGKDEQSIARWEKKRLSKAERVPADSERMIRMLYLETVGPQPLMRDFLQLLAELEDISELKTSFRETENGWETAAA